MAKGLRSSVKKANRTKLRSRVFQPVEDARAERLHAKLLETIQQDKPEPAKKNTMDIDTEADNTAQDATKEDEFPKDMDVDGAATVSSSTKSKKRNADKKAKKQRGRKAKNQIAFPATHGKGALKPHSSRVSKRR